MGFGLSVPVCLLIAVMAISAALLLALTWEMTFYQDTWALLMNRRDLSADTLFAPHNEHIGVFPVLIEQLLIRLFGMTTARPEYLLLVIALLGTASLLFVYLRRRVGEWLALFAVTLILFLGPAWEVLLWPFEISYVGSVLFGLAALLLIEREDRAGDVAACACLTLAAGFSSLGIPFLVGGAVALVVGPRERWPSRAFLVVVPAVLFSAWYFAWGNQAESHVSLANALDAPRYVAEALVANLGSAVGLNPDPTTGALGRGPNPEPGLNPVWNWIIVGAIVGAIVLRQLRGARLSPLFWPAAAIALTNWVLTALNYFPGREPTNSRYQYAGGVFVLMLVASLFDGIRPSRRIVAAAGAGAALAVVPHVIVLEKGADFLDEQSVLTRADTAAIEIARNTVDPAFQLTSEVAGTSTLPNIYAGEYLKATGEYGSPAYTPAELEAAPQPGRYQADIVLIHALPVALSTELGGFVARSSRSSCPALPLGEKPEIELRPGTTARIEVAPGPDARFRLRRFSRGKYPITTEGKPGGSVSELSVPADAASLPWRLLVEAEQAVHVCR